MSEAIGSEAWEYDSAQRPPRWSGELRELLSARELVVALVARDLRVRYKRSALGALWSMASPLALLAVLAVALSQVFGRGGASYPLFLYPGLIFWSFFTQATSGISGSVAAGLDIVRRVRIPKTAIPVSIALANAVHLLFGAAIAVVIVVATGRPLTISLLTVPLAIGIATIFALGTGLVVASLAVEYRDISDVYQSVLPILMFASPVIYPATIIPEPWRGVAARNPLIPLLSIFRAPFESGSAAPARTFAAAAAIALGTLVLGWVLFARKADDLAYHA